MKSKVIFFVLMLLSVAYTNAQKGGSLPEKEKSHTFYATGNLATSGTNSNNVVLKAIADEMKVDASSTLLLMGNNASLKGFKKNENKAKQNIDSYAPILQPFSDRIIFIPGHSDWNMGIKDLKAQENYLEGLFNNKDVFQPEKGCPIEKVKVNADVDLILLDSQWALSDWNKIPNINDNCHIKSKLEFYVEVEHEIVKSQGKTVLVALYHPISSYGKYGGSYSLGLNPQHLSNKYYKEFSDRLFTIAQQSKNVVFVSGHEQNMQYIVDKKVPVIISGASGDIVKASNGKKSKFHSNEKGFSKIVEYKDGSMWVSFYGASNNFTSPLFASEIISAPENVAMADYNEESTPEYVSKSIYKPEELERSGFYKALWGEHFRQDYETPVNVKAALLDTLYGGLSVVRKGGGHQTNSLRLATNDGRQFVMRSAKKSALRFIQYFIFKTEYLDADVEDTYFIQLLQDYWTTANPYGSLTIGDLSDALNIYHANTEMYFIPKLATAPCPSVNLSSKKYILSP